MALVQTGDKFTVESFRVSLPRPPRLSPLEVVQGKRPPPWLTSFELDAVEGKNLTYSSTQGTWQAKGTGRAYFEYNNKNSRAIIPVTITELNKPNNASIIVRWEIANIDAPVNDTSQIVRTGTTNYEIFVWGELELTAK